jgi:hypothetical protein
MMDAPEWFRVMGTLDNERGTAYDGLTINQEWPKYPDQDTAVEEFDDWYYTDKFIRVDYKNWRVKDAWFSEFRFPLEAWSNAAQLVINGWTQHAFYLPNIQFAPWYPFGEGRKFSDRVRFRPGRFDPQTWLTMRDVLLGRVHGDAVRFHDTALYPWRVTAGYEWPLELVPLDTEGKRMKWSPKKKGGDWVGDWWEREQTRLWQTATDAYDQLKFANDRRELAIMEPLWKPFKVGWKHLPA